MFKQNFITVCRAHGLALASERQYWHQARRFILWTGAKSAADLEADATEKFRRYLSSMANKHPNRINGDEGVSAATQNSAFHSIRFLYEKVLGITLGDLSKIPRASGHTRIVDVPPMDIARRIVEAVPGDTGLALRLILATAARLNDITRLRVKDFDFRRKLISIQESKGGVSRIVPMPEGLKSALAALVRGRDKQHAEDLAAGFGWVHMPGNLAKKYPKEQKTLGWQCLFASGNISKDPFTGNFGRHHIQDITLQRAFAAAKAKLRIRRHYTIHGLRHCTAQWWESNGVTRSQIQTLLGHKNPQTTDLYLRSGIKSVASIPTPI